MMAYDTRAGCQQYGSRGRTFPPMCSVRFSFDTTDGSRGAVWQNSIWHGNKYEAKRHVMELFHAERKWHSLALINACWMILETKQWMWAKWGGAWCISAVVTAKVVTSHGADFYKRGIQAVVHHWQKMHNGGTYIVKWCFVAENLLYLVLLCSSHLLWFP